MAWLFERTIEVAAWLAMIVAWVSAGLAVFWFVKWCGTLQLDFPDHALLLDSARAAAACVGFSVALGALACVDRFIYDADATKA
jgi:hypothetical protein